MKKRIIGLVAVSLLTLTGCGTSYPSEEAIKNGDIVMSPERANIDRFEIFLKKVDAQKKDTIRMTNYTTEGDAIIEDITFDGKEFEYSLDSSRDEYGSETDDRNKEVCQNLKEQVENDQSIFTLTDCEEGTDHEIFKSDPDELKK